MFGSSSPDKGAEDGATESVPGDAKSEDDTLTKTASRGSRKSSLAAEGAGEKKRRSSGVGQRASSLLASAKNTLTFSPNPNSRDYGKTEGSGQTALQRLGAKDPALSVPQGQHNNSAGESHPGPRSTFKVGVWEDKNKKCRRTMEDTHAFLYNFLHTPAPSITSEGAAGQGLDKSQVNNGSGASLESVPSHTSSSVRETDNGYFAIFDGHAGTFAADWCGKKLHIVLEDIIRKNPNTPIPELLDLTFTSVDRQLENLPLKNSGCTAIVAVLRWEDRVPSHDSATGSGNIASAAAAALKPHANEGGASLIGPLEPNGTASSNTTSTPSSIHEVHQKLKSESKRSRVLYTANVGDARIVLCRNGKALRLSYDHKGSDEMEGRRIANAGGLILNNRVNGVLAVTRALGDAYMKELVTGHPYTTETVVQPDTDEFIILACDGLWDVCSDQEAVDIVRNIYEPVQAAKVLVEHALNRFSTDNLSCMVVRLNQSSLLNASENPQSAIGVEGDPSSTGVNQVSEAEKIVGDAKKHIRDGHNAVGVSGSNSGRGHDPVLTADMLGGSTMDQMERVIEEEPRMVQVDNANEMDVSGSATVDPTHRAILN